MTDLDRLCAACADSIPRQGGLACLLQRSPVDDRMVYCAARRLGGPCGPEGNQWTARAGISGAVAAILRDPTASDWLKSAIISAEARDPVAARRDAETLLAALAACEKAPSDSVNPASPA